MSMKMGTWVLSFCLMAIETWGSIYFFDTFLKKKDMGWLERYRYIILYFSCFVVVYFGNYFVPIGIKVLLMISAFMVFCILFYKIDWKQCIFFSGLNYSILFLTDFFLLLIENILTSKSELYVLDCNLLLLPMKIVWILLLFVLCKMWKGRNNYSGFSYKEWRKFCVIPLFTIASMLLMYFCYSGEKKVQVMYLFFVVGMIIINFLVVVLMQDILMKGELLQERALTDQKRESQLAHYRDMQTVYERQGQKMHDYKNQLKTIQVLLKKGEIQAATALAERLTESISVEMAAVNTNHPVVDAVLNQKFHTAREQGVSMMFRVGDMGGLRMDEEETVILFSNLLDNAIYECVKVIRQGRKAVIHVKMIQENERLIFSVRNPVEKKVQVTDGIGLTNVKAVVDKYGGDFAVSCDEEKFQAVVML